MDKKFKAMIAAGGTGGHVFPGVAIAEEIKAIAPGSEIVFAGTSRGLEASVLPDLGYRLVLIKSSSIKDRKGAGRLLAWLRLPLSVAQSVRVMMREKPDVLVSIGGYAAGPMSAAAWLVRVPFVVVEPNAIAGFTNRVIGRFAKRAFVAFDEAKKYFPESKTMVSGNPVRREVLAAVAGAHTAEGKFRVFVFGGSQGAMRLNRAIVDSLDFMDARMKNAVKIIHQTGANDDIRAIKSAYEKSGVEADVFEFTDRIWERYAVSDLVLSRSGATTIAELVAIAMPSILVPYPYAADDHQRANAIGVSKVGGAVVVMDSECTGDRVAAELKKFMEDKNRIVAMKKSLEGLKRGDAAKIIAGEVIKLAGHTNVPTY